MQQTTGAEKQQQQIDTIHPFPADTTWSESLPSVGPSVAAAAE